MTVLDIGRQVSHLVSGKTHLWNGGLSPVCNSWKCGSPDAAASQAIFLPLGTVVQDVPTTPNCRLCYSARLSFLRLPPVDEDGVGDPPNSSTSGGSSETESWLDPSHNEPGETFPAENFGEIVVIEDTEMVADDPLELFS